MSDINVTAHGINPETGEYLSPAERKALFKKGRMGSKIDPSSFKSGVVSGVKAAEKARKKAESEVQDFVDLEREMDKVNEDAARGGGSGGATGAIVPFSSVDAGPLSTEVQNLEPPVEKVRVNVDDAPPQEAEESKETFKDALKKLLESLRRITNLKSKQGKAGKKTDKLRGKQKKKTAKKEKKTPGRDIFGVGRKIKGKVTNLFGDIFGLFGDIIAFAALNWISNPKNRKAVKGIVAFLGHAFKFINFLVGGFIDNTLTGLAQLLGPDRSIGERFSGALRLLGSFFALRWLRKPWKIIGDLKKGFKIFSKFGKFVNKIFRKPIKLIQNFVQKALNKSLGKLFKSAIFKPFRRFIIQVGGKSLFKLLGAVGRGFVKIISRVPFIGALLQFFMDVFLFKQPPARSAFKSIGGALLGAVGMLGGPIGAIIGGWVGGEAGGWLYDAWFGSGHNHDDKRDESGRKESDGGNIKSPSEQSSPTSTNAGGLNTPVTQSTDVQANIQAILKAADEMNYTGDIPALLAIAKGESGIQGIPEQPITSADRAAAIWSISKGEAQQLLDSGGWRALYNEVYGWSGNSLGNRPGTNDGSDFIGRGFIQITGRHNYKDIGDRIGVDFMSNPDALLDKDIAAKATIAFMQRGGSPKDMESALRAVGGIKEGWPKKRRYYKEFQSYGGGTGIPLRKYYPMGRSGAKQFKLARKSYNTKLTSKTPKNSTFASESASFTINEKMKTNQTSSTIIVNNIKEENLSVETTGLILNKDKKSVNQVLSRL